ncbi:hypothetical protein BGZ61DRAFT_467626 [Ilyonectria robusta]|uniref:uncharacterized protein n=1 Tax=Ilyonectria robusta TaxID=1079257 RepID=UPI001E8DAA8C|nr:uncharacterized protein BGZ61DRAFT_467626 [Ilyonectria robusta]KAH8654685.1 hypothetical protein BGZ61DRAFT_467626 [Ilyonectria robusta]
MLCNLQRKRPAPTLHHHHRPSQRISPSASTSHLLSLFQRPPGKAREARRCR